MTHETPPNGAADDADGYGPVAADDLLDSVWRLDMALRITYASRGTEVLLGIPADAFIGSPLSDLTTTADIARLREALAGLLASPDRTAGLRQIINLRHADGHLVPCEFHGRHVLDRRGEPEALVGVLRDVSDRLRNDQTARQTELRRLELQKIGALAQFAGGVVGDLEALLEALDGCPETDGQPELAPVRRQAAERIAQLRTLAGRQDLELREVDVDALVAAAIAGLRPELHGNTTLIHQRRSGGSTIWADRARLRQVLDDLLCNARDALPQGGVVTVTTGLREAEAAAAGPPSAAPRPWVTIEVRDTGPGLDPATRERILEPFFTTKNGGAGLSLPLANAVIDLHGGRLEVESEPGRGSAFRIVVPARFAGLASTAAEDDGAARATVLLVEDDPEIMRYCGQVLAADGLAVIACADGVEALASIAGDDPVDLVVLDWALPGLDGSLVREQLARRHPHVPLLIISGHRRSDYESLGGIDQDTPWLLKPFTPSALLAAVRALLPARAPGS